MTAHKIPRLKDVAREANVSMAAASRILRGESKSFKPETRQRVLDAAKRIGWRRNLIVSSMQTGRTHTVGVMMPPVDSFWTTVISGIHIGLAEQDYLPITVWNEVDCVSQVAPIDYNEQVSFKLINHLLDRRVDALILYPPLALAYSRHIEEMRDRKVPVAVIDYEPGEDDTTIGITTDEAQAADLVVQHLWELGHRRIATIVPPDAEWATWSRRRRDHFIAATAARGIETHVCSYREDQDFVETATSMIKVWQPTAVFAQTDVMAEPVYRAAARLGLSIPTDLTVMGFANLRFSEYLHPTVTTVDQQPLEMGRKAAQAVLDRLDRKDAESTVKEDDTSTDDPLQQLPSVIRQECKLVLRNSTAPPVAR